MFTDVKDRPEFKAWLISTLEPMCALLCPGSISTLIQTCRCDADPVVMSDYIVALLEHDAVMSEAQWKEVGRRDCLGNNS